MAKKYNIEVSDEGALMLEIDLDKDYSILVRMRKLKKNGGMEGYVVRVFTDIDNVNDKWEEWSRNVFGTGLYARDMAEKHFRAVCNCVIEGYESCIVHRTRRSRCGGPIEDFGYYLDDKMSSIRVKVDPESKVVERGPIEFKELFDFGMYWNAKKRNRIEKY